MKTPSTTSIIIRSIFTSITMQITGRVYRFCNKHGIKYVGPYAGTHDMFNSMERECNLIGNNVNMTEEEKMDAYTAIYSKHIDAMFERLHSTGIA